MEDRQHPDLPDVPLANASLPPADPYVMEKLGEAELETEDLQKELERLDQEWSKQLGEPDQPESSAASESPPQAPTAVANVISLANRIRDLKKGLGTPN